MQKGLLSLKICLAGLLVLAMVRHFASAAQGHGYHHGTGRPSGRPPPRRTRPRAGTPPHHHSWSGSGAPPTGRHHSHPTGKHPKQKAVWVLVQFEITNEKWRKDFENENSESYKKLANYIAKKVKDSPYNRMLKGVQFKYFKKGTKGVVSALALSLLPPPPPSRGKKRDPAKRVKRVKEMLKRIFYKSSTKVDPNSILVKPIKPKEPADPDQLTEDKDHLHHLSHEGEAAIVVVASVLFCVSVAVGIWYFVKRNRARKQDSAVQEFDNPIKFGSAASVA